MLNKRIIRSRAHGWGVVAMDRFRRRRSNRLAMLERLPELVAGMVGLQNVDVHVFVGLTDTAKTKWSGRSGSRIGLRESWV